MTTLTPELFWLLLTALLAGSLWIPYVIGANVTDFPGKAEQFARPPDLRGMKAWVHRSWRAHQNALEQLLPFGLVVLIGTHAGVSTPATRWCAAVLFWLRLLHAVGVISGLARFPIRPMLYFSGWVAMIVYACQIFVAGGRG